MRLVKCDVRNVTDGEAQELGYAGAREYLEHYCALYDREMTGYPLSPTTGNKAVDFVGNEAFWLALYERPLAKYLGYLKPEEQS